MFGQLLKQSHHQLARISSLLLIITHCRIKPFYYFLNPQIGQSLICYDCPSYGAKCSIPGDENFGELMECPDSPKAACLSIYRLIYQKNTFYYQLTQNMKPYFSKICVFRTQISANCSKSGV
jgi:hypothetical protein